MLGFEPEYVPARGQRVREGRIDRSGRQRIATSTPSRPSSANCAAPSEAPTSYDAVRGDTGGKTAGCGPRQGFGSGSPKAGPRRIKKSFVNLGISQRTRRPVKAGKVGHRYRQD